MEYCESQRCADVELHLYFVPLKLVQAHQTSGYCGADLKLLCVEAALASLRRRYPQIYKSTNKRVINVDQVVPGRRDFETALEQIVPASKRAASSEGRELPAQLIPLLGDVVQHLVEAFNTRVGRFITNAKRRPTIGGGAGQRVDFSKEDFRVVYGIINDEACCVCEKGGELVCCDTCSHAIHLACVHPTRDMPVDTDSDAPWYCRRCRDEGKPPTSQSSQSQSTSMTLATNSAASLKSANDNVAVRSNCFQTSSLVHTYRPCVIVHANNGDQGQHDVAVAFLAAARGFSVFSLALPSLMQHPSATVASACSEVLDSARRNSSPSIIFIPLADQWWQHASPELRLVFRLQLETLPADSPVAFVLTTACSAESLDPTFRRFFSNTFLDADLCVELRAPKPAQRKAFFAPLFAVLLDLAKADRTARAEAATAALSTPRGSRSRGRRSSALAGTRLYGNTMRTHSSDVIISEDGAQVSDDEEELPIAPPEEPRGPTIHELHQQRQRNQRDEHYLRELRVFFREVLRELYKDPKFKYFREMINLDELPDYMDYIAEPMFFDEMRLKVDEHLYSTFEDFEQDLILIRDNAIEYNGVQNHRGRRIVHQVRRRGLA